VGQQEEEEMGGGLCEEVLRAEDVGDVEGARLRDGVQGDVELELEGCGRGGMEGSQGSCSAQADAQAGHWVEGLIRRFGGRRN